MTTHTHTTIGYAFAGSPCNLEIVNIESPSAKYYGIAEGSLNVWQDDLRRRFADVIDCLVFDSLKGSPHAGSAMTDVQVDASTDNYFVMPPASTIKSICAAWKKCAIFEGREPAAPASIADVTEWREHYESDYSCFNGSGIAEALNEVKTARAYIIYRPEECSMTNDDVPFVLPSGWELDAYAEDAGEYPNHYYHISPLDKNGEPDYTCGHWCTCTGAAIATDPAEQLDAAVEAASWYSSGSMKVYVFDAEN